MTKLMKAFCGTAFLVGSVMNGFADGPAIGAPNGVSYEIVAQHEVVRMDAGHCGYHDLSLPNGGVYHVETRVYHEHNQGRLVRTWTQEVETFERCYEP
jgi:hypothetical protein